MEVGACWIWGKTRGAESLQICSRSFEFMATLMDLGQNQRSSGAGVIALAEKVTIQPFSLSLGLVRFHCQWQRIAAAGGGAKMAERREDGAGIERRRSEDGKVRQEKMVYCNVGACGGQRIRRDRGGEQGEEETQKG